jgi:hypothetical protein
MTVIPATQQAWLVTLDADELPIPIIGWDKGPAIRAWPILPIHKKAFVAGEAFMFKDCVVDPVWGRTFFDLDTWRETFEDEKPYKPGALPAAATPEVKAAATAAVPASSKAIETDPEFAARLTFGKKRNKTKSFWHVVSDPEFCFELAGEKLLPVGEDVSKITRDAFFELRKTVTQAAIDPDNLPAPADFDDEDDADGDDLI